MKAQLIVNEKAGTFLRPDTDLTGPALRAALSAARLTLAPADPSTPPASLDAQLSRALQERPDVVLVGGGDGTLSAAAGRLAGSGLALGVLPLGTLNHFAKDLGMPADWRDAAASFATAVFRNIDVAEVNGRVFINNCSLGAYAEAVHRRDQLRRRAGHGKWRAMLLACWSVFRELRRPRLQIELPGRTLSLRTPFVVVANNRYRGSVLDAALRPRLDGGQLHVYASRARNRFGVLRMAWQSLLRGLDAAEALEEHAAAEVTIMPRSRRRLRSAADGELLDLSAPFRFRVRPAALRVLAPPPSPPS